MTKPPPPPERPLPDPPGEVPTAKLIPTAQVVEEPVSSTEYPVLSEADNSAGQGGTQASGVDQSTTSKHDAPPVVAKAVEEPQKNPPTDAAPPRALSTEYSVLSTPSDTRGSQPPAPVAAQTIHPPKPGPPASQPDLPTQLWFGFFFAWETIFGLMSMIFLLAFLATIPILNMLSLGYLLEASGRVSRSGRMRDGFIGLSKAYRVGTIIAGTSLMLLPLVFLRDTWYEASLIDPTSGVTRAWRIGLIICTGLMLMHIVLAWYAGGKFRHFFWPFVFPFELFYGFLVWRHRRQLVHNEWPPPILLAQGLWRGDIYQRSRDYVWDFVQGLRLPYYFWLGVRGFVGALAWLIIPIGTLIAAANMNQGPGFVFSFLGGMMLAFVLLYLPFMQAHFAAENRFKAMFEWLTVRRLFRRAPIAFWFALLITLAFALPLFTLKIAAPPEEIMWLPSLVFVLFILPARLFTGWAMGRARHREQPRFFLFRWMARLAALPVVAVYALNVFLTQYTSAYGSPSMLEQHAFLVPVPFLGL